MDEQKGPGQEGLEGLRETDPAVLFLELLESGLKSRFVATTRFGQKPGGGPHSADGRPVERLITHVTGYAVFA